MAGDPLQHVQSGDPLAIQAETFNCLIDAARDYKQRTRHLGRTARPSFPNTTIVSVRNDTGSDQPRFAALGLDAPIIAPADNAAEFASRATAVGVLPTTDHVGRWCVLAEPIAAGAIGKAWVAGLFPSRVFVVNGDAAELDRCEVRDGVAGLEMTHHGTARVVWKEPGTGELWALLLPDGGPAPRVWSVTMIDTVEEKPWDFATSGQATLDDTGETIDVVAGDQFTGVAFRGHRAWAVPPEPGETEWRLVDGGTTFIVVHADEDVAKGTNGAATISGSPAIGVTIKASLHGCKEGDLLYCWWDSPGGGHWDFLRDTANSLTAGCGLALEDDVLSLNPPDLVGFALRESDDTEDCKVEVDPNALAGCGLKTDGPGTPLDFDAAGVVGFGIAATNECGLAVDTSQLAGCALISNLVTGLLDVDPTMLAGPGLLSFGLCGLQVDTGCGLAIVNDQIVFDPTFVAGVDSGLDTDGSCGLKVRTGCGIKIELGSVTFDADSVAGAALYASPGTCLLNVSVGDGLEIVADTIVVKAGCSLITNSLDGSLEVDVATLAGDGLIRSAGVTCDELAVQPGCGLEIAANKSVQVRRIELLGEGLKAGDGSDCELAVDWEEFPGGCGLQLNAGFWDIDNETIAGEGLAAGIGCTLGVAVGCGIQIDGDAVAVNPLDLESADIGPTGFGCALETKGATCTVAVVEDVTADEYGDLVVTKRNLEFVNGLLKDCDAA